MKRLLCFTTLSLSIFLPMLSHAFLNHSDLVGRYQVYHAMIELTLEISAQNKVHLFEKPATADDEPLDCKSESYKIRDNIFETTLDCASKGTKQFRADLTGVNPERLNQGVQVPIDAFGNSLVVVVKRK